jgi:urea carboxylase
MVKKVLIANRGAIACRIARTLRRLGIGAVAVYSEADVESRHVMEADAAVCIGTATPADTYLNQDKLLEAARATGCEAVHPGYGFLSENAEFAARCEASGFAFIGPSAEHIRQFGLKHAARALAAASGVPLLAGTDLIQDLEQARREAESIGYPVMLKSTAGGGGIGLRLCHDHETLSGAFDAVRRLSASHFGAAGAFLEKYLARARHVEVQIFGDGLGRVISLGDRDCSLQRRHQKVIEESPAPGIADATRERMAECATRLSASPRR